MAWLDWWGKEGTQVPAPSPETDGAEGNRLVREEPCLPTRDRWVGEVFVVSTEPKVVVVVIAVVILVETGMVVFVETGMVVLVAVSARLL